MCCLCACFCIRSIVGYRLAQTCFEAQSVGLPIGVLDKKVFDPTASASHCETRDNVQQGAGPKESVEGAVLEQGAVDRRVLNMKIGGEFKDTHKHADFPHDVC